MSILPCRVKTFAVSCSIAVMLRKQCEHDLLAESFISSVQSHRSSFPSFSVRARHLRVCQLSSRFCSFMSMQAEVEPETWLGGECTLLRNRCTAKARAAPFKSTSRFDSQITNPEKRTNTPLLFNKALTSTVDRLLQNSAQFHRNYRRVGLIADSYHWRLEHARELIRLKTSDVTASSKYRLADLRLRFKRKNTVVETCESLLGII